MLLSRLHQHEQALTIYAHRLGDAALAEKCPPSPPPLAHTHSTLSTTTTTTCVGVCVGACVRVCVCVSCCRAILIVRGEW